MTASSSELTTTLPKRKLLGARKWRAAGSALQWTAGLLLLAGLVGATLRFLALPPVPVGWSIIRPPHDATALATQLNILWAGGRHGLVAIDRQTGEVLAIEGVPAFRQIMALAIDREGALWVAHRHGVTAYDGRAWRNVSLAPEANGQAALALCQSTDGSMWVGCERGLIRCRGEQREWLALFASAAAPSVDAIYQDRNSHIWAACSSPLEGRLARFDGARWTHYGPDCGLSSLCVSGFCETPTGEMWLATGAGSLGAASRQVPAGWENWDEARGLARGKARCIFADRGGRIWVGHEFSGLSVIGNKDVRIISRADSLPGDEVKQVLEDADGAIWLATTGGVVRLAPEIVEPLISEEAP